MITYTLDTFVGKCNRDYYKMRHFWNICSKIPFSKTSAPYPNRKTRKSGLLPTWCKRLPKGAFKSNNKNNILINQVLRLPLLKHTKNNKIMIIKTGSTKLPPQGKVTLQQLRRRSPQQQSRDRSRQLLSQRSPP